MEVFRFPADSHGGKKDEIAKKNNGKGGSDFQVAQEKNRGIKEHEKENFIDFSEKFSTTIFQKENLLLINQ